MNDSLKLFTLDTYCEHIVSLEAKKWHSNIVENIIDYSLLSQKHKGRDL